MAVDTWYDLYEKGLRSEEQLRKELEALCDNARPDDTAADVYLEIRRILAREW